MSSLLTACTIVSGLLHTFCFSVRMNENGNLKDAGKNRGESGQGQSVAMFVLTFHAILRQSMASLVA